MCSVAKWSNNGIATVVGRSMDFLKDLESNLWLFPRGMEREGLAGENSLTWTSKYGSVVTTTLDYATADGMNENGLGVHLLWLAESDYGKRDQSIPGISITLWGQYFLDNFANVNEAVDFVRNHPFQVLPINIPGVSGNHSVTEVHLRIEDVSGDAAVFEYTNGAKPAKIYHGKQYDVMTNSPTFDKQIENLKQYVGFGGDKTLPGSTEAADRFVRAAYYTNNLPKKITTTRQAIAGILSVLRNVSEPITDIFDPTKPNISPTLWRTVLDLTNKVYYFESTTSPNIIWIRFDELDFSQGSPVKKIDLVNYPDRIGNVSSEFKNTEPFAWGKPEIM